MTLPVLVVLPAQATNGPPPGQPRVVTDRLDNPRQLSWDEKSATLLVAEAGRGGTSCFGEGEDTLCAGLTGRITEVSQPSTERAAARTAARGLLSVAGPNGSFAVGSDGVDATDVADEYIVAVTGPPPGGLPEGAADVAGVEQLGHLVVSGRDDGAPFVLPYADLVAAEKAQNPDTAQIESNPYATVYVDPTPSGPARVDGYALVADAAANTVWKVQPRYAETPPNAPPPYDVTVFATFPTTALPDGSDDPKGPPEFVPTSLALDRSGHVFVGGLGSEVQGAAQVVQYDLAGKEIRRWTGFTGITGIAVGADNLYVSQLFGSVPPAPPGNTPDDEAPQTPPQAVPGTVVRTSHASTDARRYEVDVPFPGGLATDGRGNVFVAANSIAPAQGVEDVFGPESFDVGGGAVWELDFTGARVIPPTPTPEPTEPPTSPEPTPSPEPGGPPADTGGQFVPVDASYYEPFSGPACGTTVTVTPADVREVQYRSTHAADGTVKVEYRGRATVDVTRASDDATLDELDVSGPGTEEFAGPDGTSITISLDGPSIVLPQADADAVAFGQAGLPYFTFFEGGTLSFVIELGAEPEGEPALSSAEVTKNTTTGVRDVCHMLDDAVASSVS